MAARPHVKQLVKHQTQHTLSPQTITAVTTSSQLGSKDDKEKNNEVGLPGCHYKRYSARDSLPIDNTCNFAVATSQLTEEMKSNKE